MPEIMGQMWRSGEEIIDEIGLAPLDLIDEIRRLERKVNFAHQMANSFDGNSRVTDSNGKLLRGSCDDTWATAARMLRSVLDDDR